MRYNCESCAVELDICELCERALRRGDLDAMPFRRLRGVMTRSFTTVCNPRRELITIPT